MFYAQTAFYRDDKGATEEGHFNEKLINKLQNLYSVTFEQNID